MMMETEEENRVVFFSLVCTLVDHTDNVVRHYMEEMPSDHVPPPHGEDQDEDGA